jgi:hypothetical protein
MISQQIVLNFPEKTPEQLTRRLINAQRQLSFLGGAILNLPVLIPGLGITRMHRYLILEIALLHSKEIDDNAQVPEMAIVVAGTGLAVGPPLPDESHRSQPFGVPARIGTDRRSHSTPHRRRRHPPLWERSGTPALRSPARRIHRLKPAPVSHKYKRGPAQQTPA